MKTKNITIIMGIFLLLATNISAFAISSQYWEENPILMQPGETKEIDIVLQNMAGREDVYATGAILENSEIASFFKPGEEYLVKAGDKTFIKLIVTIPKENYEENYNIVLSFRTKEEGSGTFGLGSSIERELPVIVQEKKKEITVNYTYLYIIGALILAIIIFFLIKRKNVKPKRKARKKVTRKKRK